MNKAAVYLWSDNDDAGRSHMERIAARLIEMGHENVRVIDLADAPPKGDAADFVATRGTTEGVRELARVAQQWQPGGILSDGSIYVEPSERIIRFYTAREIAEMTPEAINWVMKPWIAGGSITEVDAKIKLGKSTWLTHGIRKVLDGLPFMDEPTIKTQVVYLTEQPPTSFRAVLRRADLLDREDFHTCFWHDTAGVDWPAIVAAAVTKCVETDAKLLVVDTLPQFAGLRGEAENSSGAALEAMAPLQAAAAEHGLAIVVIRHDRKSGGEVGDSARGSSAFGGAVDVVLSMRRGDGNTRPTIRVIHSLSRFNETPDTLVIELTDGGYVALGNEVAVAASEARTAILEHAPILQDNALTKPKLLDKLDGVKSTTAQTTLENLMEEGLIQRIGEGKKGSPYRYWQPLDDAGEKHSDESSGVPSETIDAAQASSAAGTSIHFHGTTYIEPSESNLDDVE